jgi:hypothetical protein
MNAVVTQQSLPGMPEPSNMLEIISRAASDPNIDVAKTEKLLEMYERISAKNAEVAFSAAMKAAQEEFPRIYRNAENTFNKTRYATLEALNKAVVPIYTKHGFSLSFGNAEGPTPDLIRITCRVSHSAGHSRDYQCDVPLDLDGAKGNQNKTRTQAFGSTMSYGRRYLTLLIFNISLTNEDDDGEGAGRKETISDEQIANLQALMEEVKADRGKMFGYLKIHSLDEIVTTSYSTIVQMLEAKRKR